MILEMCNKAKEQNKQLYIRGTTWTGIALGIYLDWNGIQFNGFVDINPERGGKIIYGKHSCYVPSQIPKKSFVLIAAKEEKVQREIASELELEDISYMNDIYSNIFEDIKCIDDKFFLENYFEAKLGYKLNWKNPMTLCEKLQWLKLYDRNPIYTTMVDKYDVKRYVEDRIGKQYVIPALGIWDCYEEIDFDGLPDQFVLKWTNDSGSIVVVNNKAELDKNIVKIKLEEHMGQNYFYYAREWPYKNVKPRIIAEPYVASLGKPESIEYKVTCFNGKVGFVTICQGIAHSTYDVRTNDSYTTNFEHMPWYAYYKNSTKQIRKPECWEALISLSEQLAADIPYVRVDWYIIDGKLYFGEITFYTWAGFIEFTPPEWDLRLGQCLQLPVKQY